MILNPKSVIQISLISLFVWMSACSGKFLKVENAEKLSQIKEYDEAMKVRELEPTPSPQAPQTTGTSPVESNKAHPTQFTSVKAESSRQKKKIKTISKAKTSQSSAKIKKISAMAKVAPPPVNLKRQPELEDDEGFAGRRPKVDPFWVGEKVTINLSYFGISAGKMELEVRPFVTVNGRKSYHFVFGAKSNPSFSGFYAVEDTGETFLDFETMLPYNYALHVKESKQLREVRSYLDWNKMKAFFWERKVTSDYGVENKDKSWDILPFSQNVFSAVYYMRTFTLRPGKTIQFRLVDEEKNLVVKAEVLRREVLETDAGKLNTLVLRPEIAIEGVFKPMGEVLFWLTDDDRKFLVQIESKIKIGKVMGYVTAIERGSPPAP